MTKQREMNRVKVSVAKKKKRKESLEKLLNCRRYFFVNSCDHGGGCCCFASRLVYSFAPSCGLGLVSSLVPLSDFE